MTAIITFMGTQGIFKALKGFVFVIMTKNITTLNCMSRASGQNFKNVKLLIFQFMYHVELEFVDTKIDCRSYSKPT